MRCKIYFDYNNTMVKCQYKINCFVEIIIETQ